MDCVGGNFSFGAFLFDLFAKQHQPQQMQRMRIMRSRRRRRTPKTMKRICSSDNDSSNSVTTCRRTSHVCVTSTPNESV